MLTNYQRTNIKFLAVLNGILEGLYCDLTMNKSEALFLDTWLLELNSSIYLNPLSTQVYESARQFSNKVLSYSDNELQDKTLDGLLTELELLQDQVIEQFNKSIDDFSEDEINSYYLAIIINELQGLCKGLIADNDIAIEEVRCLANWLDEYKLLQNDPLASKFFSFFNSIDIENLSSNELEQLKRLLVDFSGSDMEGNADGLSLGDSFFDQINDLDLNGKVIQLTGKFKFGSRQKCKNLAISQGATVIDDFRLDLDYLIVGSFNSRDWMYQSYGKKIEIAKQYQLKRAHKVKIISETQWIIE
ncbi:BRCT domain-containing protein [Pasteurella oralis]|uniref:BRCT domain-containing protein n=1 Tax=Pasteurella oralis TaxID=1071947 RepID=A0ABW4NWC0_9PAST